MGPLDQNVKDQLERYLIELETKLDCDVMSIIGPILPGLETVVRDAIEALHQKRSCLAIVLDTPGGVVEVVERIVNAIRYHYSEVTFIVPNRAMSAGTVFVMSGDRVMMDYFSCLGPIDPQIEKEGKLVPALSYLEQFYRLNEKARAGELTTAEYALLSKLDLGELYQFEQARDLSIELLKKWLSTYWFKDWVKTETRGLTVDAETKEKRAEQIAEALNKPERWHSHGRGINKKTLTEELGLRINDLSEVEGLKDIVTKYFELLQDYVLRQQLWPFVHTKAYF